MFNYDAPEKAKTNYQSFSWGVHKVTIDDFEVKELPSEAFAISCSISGDFGMSARFVSLGFYNKPKTEADSKQFAEATRDYRKSKELNRTKFSTKATDSEKEAAKREADKLFEKWKKNKMYSLAQALEELVAFGDGFGVSDAIRAITGAAGLKEYLESIMKLLKGKTAYALIMEKDQEKAGRVNTNYNFAQNFQAPRSWSVVGVEKVEFNRETLADSETGEVYLDDAGNPKMGEIESCTITYSNAKARPTTVKKSATNYVKLTSTVPNDDSDLPSAGFVPPSFSGSEETDDLPF